MTAASTLELLTWVASRPRTYAETIEVWRSNCPRLCVWEDALADGLIRIEQPAVTLTELGRAALVQPAERQ